MGDTAWKFEHSVEWVKLLGPFVVGTLGAAKTPGREPYAWKITQLDPEHSGTIEMPLDGAVFCNVMIMESIGPNRTRITQRLSLTGIKAIDFAEGT